MDGGSEYLAALRNSNPSQATLQNYLKDNTALIVRLHHELAFGRAKNRPENQASGTSKEKRRKKKTIFEKPK
jgi:hypothetical protein